MMRKAALLVSFLVAIGGAASGAWAQGVATVAKVNDRAITRYELDQRTKFLTLLNAPGDVQQMALDALIEDRLRQQAAKAAGVVVTEDMIKGGMAEFAARANLDTEQFIAALAEGGVDAQTFRDFVAAGLAWRGVVRAKFGDTRPSEGEVTRALSLTSQRTPVDRVFLAEIILPTTGPEAANNRARAERLAQEIKTESDFSTAASRFSSTPTRTRGGVVGWVPVESLPPELRGAILALKKDQVTAPIDMGEGVAIYQVRGIQSGAPLTPANTVVTYLQYRTASTAEAEALRGKLDSCIDLYGAAKGQPAERLVETTQTMAEVPADIAAELNRLDPGEASTSLVRGGAPVLVMLCDRQRAISDPALAPRRDQIAEELFNGRLGGLADGYLADLKADAVITLY